MLSLRLTGRVVNLTTKLLNTHYVLHIFFRSFIPFINTKEMFKRNKNAPTLIQMIFYSPTARDREDRLRLIKDRQNEERQKKLEELKAQALAAQKYREQKEEERKRRIEEMRLKENDKRQQVSLVVLTQIVINCCARKKNQFFVNHLQVEDRKKAIMDAEKERREYILRKNQVNVKSFSFFIFISFDCIPYMFAFVSV